MGHTLGCYSLGSSTCDACTKVLARCTSPVTFRNVNYDDLLNYRRDLVAEHQSELAAIDRLMARERAKQPTNHNTNGSSVAAPTRVSGRKASVGPAISKALGKIGNGNFTKEHVIAYLNQMGVSMEGWGPRAVGVNLWRRAKVGELAVVKDGKGGGEVIYRKG